MSGALRVRCCGIKQKKKKDGSWKKKVYTNQINQGNKKSGIGGCALFVWVRFFVLFCFVLQPHRIDMMIRDEPCVLHTHTKQGFALPISASSGGGGSVVIIREKHQPCQQLAQVVVKSPSQLGTEAISFSLRTCI